MGSKYIEKYDGSLTGIIGLPLEKLALVLLQFSVKLKSDWEKIVEKEIGKFSQEERFKRRIAVAINFNGNKFSDAQIKELAKSALSDLDGNNLKEKLLETEFSTKIQK